MPRRHSSYKGTRMLDGGREVERAAGIADDKRWGGADEEEEKEEKEEAEAVEQEEQGKMERRRVNVRWSRVKIEFLLVLVYLSIYLCLPVWCVLGGGGGGWWLELLCMRLTTGIPPQSCVYALIHKIRNDGHSLPLVRMHMLQRLN